MPTGFPRVHGEDSYNEVATEGRLAGRNALAAFQRSGASCEGGRRVSTAVYRGHEADRPGADQF